MAVVKGDRVLWRGRESKVLEVRSEELTLHVGEGRIVRQVGVRDYTVLTTPEPPTPISTKKPKPRVVTPSAMAPIAKARRKVSTGKGKK